MPPGKEGKIELAVEHTVGYAGDVAKGATVTTNDPKFANFQLTLRAHFVEEPGAKPTDVPAPAKLGPVVIEPTNMLITSVLVGNTTNTSLYVVNRETPPVHVKSIDAGGKDFTATLVPVQDGRRYEIQVRSAADLKPGTYHQTLTVMTDSAASPVIPVQLNITVYARINVSPTAIIMPQLPINAELTAITWPTITVTKVQATGLEIKRVSSSLAFLDVTAEPQRAGQIYQVRIKINPNKAKAGDFKGTIRIETNDADMPVLEVPVQVTLK
ncbi:MAG TPA: hypothetical protein VKA60_22780 [Blastocatellia bacterium]|nr:hypothetical protein [Blastocatellia bacterium]